MIFSNEVAQIIASQSAELCNLKNQLAGSKESESWFYKEWEKQKLRIAELEGELTHDSPFE
jgi:hypothetical protein